MYVPELPEVETVRRTLEPHVLGRRFVDAWAHPSPKFRTGPEVVGPTVAAVRRRGKYLILDLDDDREFIVHLGMTGQLTWNPHLGEPDDYVRAWWRCADGSGLSFRDVRRFGRIAVVPTGDHRSMPTLHNLGPEPFDPELTDVAFWRSLNASRRHLKTQLLSQQPIAGVGNIYADEALWLAQVAPADRHISRPRAAALLAALREVLGTAIAHGGTTLRDYRTADGSQGEHQQHLRCYGRGGEECERCGGELSSRQLDARTTTWCRSCQPRR